MLVLPNESAMMIRRMNWETELLRLKVLLQDGIRFNPDYGKRRRQDLRDLLHLKKF